MTLPRSIGLIAGLATLFAGPLPAAELEALLEWGGRVELGTPLAGMVSSVEVREGQQVAQGDLLLTLDQRLFQARLEQAQAAAQEAEQLKLQAEREWQRARELHDRALLSDRKRALAQIDAARAGAAWRKAQAEQTQAQLELEYSQLRAPFSGVVVAVYVKPWQAVVNQTQVVPLLALANNTEMVARALINSEQAQHLQIGADVPVMLRGQRLPGKVLRIGLEPERPDGLGILYQLDVGFVPPQGATLRAGEAATLELKDLPGKGNKEKEPADKAEKD